MEETLSIDDCALRLSKYNSSMTYDEIKNMLVIMKNHDSNWIKPAIFVYKLYSRGSFSMTQILLTKITGYSRAHIYNFKKAGERIFNQRLNPQDLQGITLIEFLNRKESSKTGHISNIQQIGNYKMGEYLNISVNLYRAYYNEDKVYFKVYRIEIAEDETIEVKKDDTKEGGLSYLYKGSEIELFNFEPNQMQSVNLHRKNW